MGHQPTSEQRDALAMFKTGESLAIEAGAGTGKTSTLILLAKSTERRGQYVAFNKAIVEEAKTKMPSNVRCNTAHSLAFGVVGKNYRHRLNGPRQKSIELAQRLGTEQLVVEYAGERKLISKTFLASYAMKAVGVFCTTADQEISGKHVPFIDGIDTVVDGKRSYTNNDIVRRYLEPILRKAWQDVSSLRGQLPFSHDCYLKLWQLSNPRIGADFIMFDEAQDANPVMQAIVAAQSGQLVWVGDSQQQIYSFTGAVNALEKVEAQNVTYLTQSFRFGPDIAEQANIVLGALDAPLRLTGTASIASRVQSVAAPDAILTRTNATAVREVLAAITAGKRPHLVGGGGQIATFVKAAARLMAGQPADHPELACFDNWKDVQEYVEKDPQGGDLRLMVNLIDEFGVDVILEALDSSVPANRADVTVCTAHKAKGLEWDKVRIASDFPEEAKGEELRLLYVAATRAKLILDVTHAKVFETLPAMAAERAALTRANQDDPSGPAEAADTPAPVKVEAPAPVKVSGPSCQGCGAASEFPVTSCRNCTAAAAAPAPAKAAPVHPMLRTMGLAAVEPVHPMMKGNGAA